MRPSSSTATSTPSSGMPSYTQPPHVSDMPYVSTTRAPAAAARSTSGAGAAAPPSRIASYAVRSAPASSSRCSWVGHQRGVAPAGRVEPLGRRRERAGVEAAVEVEHLRRGAGRERAHQHGQAGDVGHRQREQPLTRTAEAPLRGQHRVAQRVSGQQHALGLAGRPRRRDDERDVVGLERQVGPQRRGDRRARAAGRQRQQRRAVAAQRRGECRQQRGEDRRTGRRGQCPQRPRGHVSRTRGTATSPGRACPRTRRVPRPPRRSGRRAGSPRRRTPAGPSARRPPG